MRDERETLAQANKTYLKIPSVWAPFNFKTASDKVVWIQGKERFGYLFFCKAITSSRRLPNIEGLKICIWKINFNQLHWLFKSVHLNICSLLNRFAENGPAPPPCSKWCAVEIKVFLLMVNLCNVYYFNYLKGNFHSFLFSDSHFC